MKPRAAPEAAPLAPAPAVDEAEFDRLREIARRIRVEVIRSVDHAKGGHIGGPLSAAELLAAEGIDAHVVHVPTIKPLDEEAIVTAAARTGFVITVEEHTVLGGLGGAVAETLADRRPTRVKRLGIQDAFGESAPNDALLEMFGLSAARVAEQVRGLLGAA